MEEGGIDPALIISIVSIVLAVLALLWNVLNATLLDRARLEVTMDFGINLIGGTPGTERTVVGVSATNIGKRPVRLNSLWLAFGRPFYWWMRPLPKKWRNRLSQIAVMLPGDDPMLIGLSSDIPKMLGVGETASLYYYEQGDVLERAEAEGFTHAFAFAGGSTAGGRSRRQTIPFPG